MLVLVMASIGIASAVRSSTDKANYFLRSSRRARCYSSDGKLIANLHGEIDRDPVALRGHPDASAPGNDRYRGPSVLQHSGIDVRGTARAFLNNLRNGDRQGGSTITQQLSKNLYFHGEPRTIWRKASEAVLALGLEGKTEKDEILEAYLNTAYFGRGVYGVQTAAKSYFRRDVAKLSSPNRPSSPV